MNVRKFPPWFCLLAALITISAEADPPPGLGPQPGELYREFSLHTRGDSQWRVTDDEATKKFPAALDHLPNADLEFTIDDLEHAVRAEVMLDRWGGHRGTINKRIQFNDGAWISIAEIGSVVVGRDGRDVQYGQIDPSLRGEMLMYQDNPVVVVDVADLKQGTNILRGDCDEAGGFGWGQWGLYAATIRVYYDPAQKGNHGQISGRIVSPAAGDTFDDHPTIEIDAAATLGVSRIDLVASYDGFDDDGDGIGNGFHESRFQLAGGQPARLTHHVATLEQYPATATWDTTWIPDQPPGSIKLQARIQNSRGYWIVTEIVPNLSLRRDDQSVVMYRAGGVPENFAVRIGETKSCTFDIPDGDNLSLATAARLDLRTWHGWDGHHSPFKINDVEMPINGKNHFYDHDQLPLPISALKNGSNQFTIHSDTEHHLLEVLWPGPAITVRYQKSKPLVREVSHEQRPHLVIETAAATYWLDKQSGGLSRLIDPSGADWIAYRAKPWDQYPGSAAASFRGLPNLLFGGKESGFGHPGWNMATTKIVSADNAAVITIESTSLSGDWKLRWKFSREHADVVITTANPDQPYWFLYEGPIGGKFEPQTSFIGTDQFAKSYQATDYFDDNRIYDCWRWAYLGSDSNNHILSLIHQTPDDHADTFAQLGSTMSISDSPDGMVVFGFGRGSDGIEPLLTGNQKFRIAVTAFASDTLPDHTACSDRCIELSH